MATNYQKLGNNSRQGFSQRLNSTEEKKFPTPRKLPDWVWKALVKILGIKLKGLRKFGMLLEEDARNYIQRFQKQEPVHLSLLNHVVSEEGADFFIWDDNIAIKPDMPETQTEGGVEKSVDSESQDNSVSIVDITESINYIESNKDSFEESDDIPSKYSLKSVLTTDQILHYYWRLSKRMRLTSTCLQRWMASWIAFIIIWCGDYILYWISHHSKILDILEFLIPLALLFIATSAFAEANFEGERMIQCIYPTEDRLRVQAFLSQQPLQMKVFNISVSYNAILGVILAFAAAIASRIILDELSM